MNLLIIITFLFHVNSIIAQYTNSCPLKTILVMPRNCSCVRGNMECFNTVTVWPTSSHAILLNKLSITHTPGFKVKNNTFQNYNVSRLELTFNSLRSDRSYIEAHGFGGLVVKDLDLSHNKLQQIPDAVALIKDLEGLDVSSNPISDFTNTRIPNQDSRETMMRVGSSLKRFAFGSGDMTEWPSELRFFPKLEELNVTEGSFSLMPMDAFYGFDQTIRKLSIQHTLLTSVPLAIAQLFYLTELHFDHNHGVGDYGMNIPIRKNPLTLLTLMSLQDDSISTFPDVVGTFTGLKQLIMDGNNMKFVSDQSASAVHQVTSLSLKNTNISRIPGAIQDMGTLTNLDLSDNEIHSIEREDLRNLSSLTELKLNNNPVLYISKDAFSKLDHLVNIELNNTQIVNIPCAIQSLKQLNASSVTVDLGSNKIDCTCGLKWIDNLKNKISGGLTVRGDCETIESTLESYISSQLRSCPPSELCKDSFYGSQ